MHSLLVFCSSPLGLFSWFGFGLLVLMKGNFSTLCQQFVFASFWFNKYKLSFSFQPRRVQPPRDPKHPTFILNHVDVWLCHWSMSGEIHSHPGRGYNEGSTQWKLELLDVPEDIRLPQLLLTGWDPMTHVVVRWMRGKTTRANPLVNE